MDGPLLKDCVSIRNTMQDNSAGIWCSKKEAELTSPSSPLPHSTTATSMIAIQSASVSSLPRFVFGPTDDGCISGENIKMIMRSISVKRGTDRQTERRAVRRGKEILLGPECGIHEASFRFMVKLQLQRQLPSEMQIDFKFIHAGSAGSPDFDADQRRTKE